MIRALLPTLILAAGLSAAMPVLAVTCYEVIDRTNAVVFSDSQTPVDLSDAGAPARDAMLKRGELLVIYDTNTCIVIGRGAATGNRKATVEEIVPQLLRHSVTISSTVALRLPVAAPRPITTQVLVS